MTSILLCDDNIDFLDSFKDTLEKIISDHKFNMRIVLKTKNPEDLLSFNSNNSDVCIYFIDMNLGSDVFNGIEIAKQIRDNDKNSYIVFITMHMEYLTMSLKGLIRPSGYLLKPVQQFEIEKLLIDINEDINSANNNMPSFYIRNGHKTIKIKYKDILYFETCEKMIKLKTFDSEYMFRSSLDDIERTCESRFLRCYQSILLNKSYIKGVSKGFNSIFLINVDREFPVSRKYKNNVKKVIYNTSDNNEKE